MHSPDATVVAGFLDEARRRHTLEMALKGASIGLGVAAVLAVIGWPVASGLRPLLLFGALAGTGGGLRWALLRRATQRTAAARIESRAPECRNLLVTASELLAGVRVDPYIETVVFRQAAAVVQTLRLPKLLPFHKAFQSLAIAAACWGGAVAWRVTRSQQAAEVAALTGPASVGDVTVTVTPPPYLGQRPRSYRNPARVEALQASRLAVEAVERMDGRAACRVLLTPQGERLAQPRVEWLARQPRLLVVAGHYEGIDERAIEELRPLELSVGDFVASGGELPALLVVDAVARLLPGALGHERSAAEDSFAHRDDAGRPLLDCPHFTRPREWRGREVPEVLLSGDHAAIAAWRREQMVRRTAERRPDLTPATAPDSTGPTGDGRHRQDPDRLGSKDQTP